MELAYLVFDFSDEDAGGGSFDALASVRPQRLEAVRAEVAAVVGWATRAFGQAAEEGEWDYQVEETAEADGRVAVALTVAGSEAFCAGLRREFGVE